MPGGGQTHGRAGQAVTWLILTLAGCFEIAWAIGLKYTEGFSRPLPSALTLVAMAASVLLLAWALKTLPVGTAYAVWTGIGALGTGQGAAGAEPQRAYQGE